MFDRARDREAFAIVSKQPGLCTELPEVATGTTQCAHIV